MLDITFLTAFLGWCTLINIGLFTFSALFIAAFGSIAKGLHNKMYRVGEENLDAVYFSFLGNYRLAIIIFNLVPYCALRILG